MLCFCTVIELEARFNDKLATTSATLLTKINRMEELRELRDFRTRMYNIFRPLPMGKKGSSVSSSASSQAGVPPPQLSGERKATLLAYYGQEVADKSVTFARQFSEWYVDKIRHPKPSMTISCSVTGLLCYPTQLTNGHLFRVSWSETTEGRKFLKVWCVFPSCVTKKNFFSLKGGWHWYQRSCEHAANAFAFGTCIRSYAGYHHSLRGTSTAGEPGAFHLR